MQKNVTVTILFVPSYIPHQIHPETDKDENIKIVCTNLDDGNYFELDDILPDVLYSDYKAISKNIIIILIIAFIRCNASQFWIGRVGDAPATRFFYIVKKSR